MVIINVKNQDNPYVSCSGNQLRKGWYFRNKLYIYTELCRIVALGYTKRHEMRGICR